MNISRMVACVALAGMMVGHLCYAKQDAAQVRDEKEKIAIAGAKASPKREAVAADKLQNRAGAIYIVNGQEPFSGMAQDFYGNGQMQWEVEIKDGKVIALKRWHENGVLALTCGFTAGALEDITMEGAEILGRRGALLDGEFAEYDHDAGITKTAIFKDGELQSTGLSFNVKFNVAAIVHGIRSGEGGSDLTGTALDVQVKDALDGALDRTIEVLRQRMNRLGIEDPIISKKTDGIRIILLGIGDDRRPEIEKTILSVGLLEFRMVHERSYELTDRFVAAGKSPAGWKTVTLDGIYYYQMTDEIPVAARDAAFLEAQGRFEAPDPRFEFFLQEMEVQGQRAYRPYLVSRRPLLRSSDIESVKLDATDRSQPMLEFAFTESGATRLGEITEQYAPGGMLNPSGERVMAVVVDGLLYSTVTIREPINSGRLRIGISAGLNEAEHFVNVLSSGALPTKLQIE